VVLRRNDQRVAADPGPGTPSGALSWLMDETAENGKLAVREPLIIGVMVGQVGADAAGIERAERLLVEACALWSLHVISSEQVVDAATDALAAGLDSQSLRVLAGTPVRAATVEVPELFPRAMAELGLPFFCHGGVDGQVVAARAMARALLAGVGTPRGLVAHMHHVFGHDAHDLIEPLVVLDDAYDAVDSYGADQADLEQQVYEAARRLVATDDV
jgi:hypothetical protein